MDVSVGWQRRLSAKQLMLLNCVVLEKTFKSPLDCKEIKPVNPKRNQFWKFIGRTDTEGEAPILWPPDAKSLTHWKRPWCWGRLKTREGDDRGWDGWRALPSRWTWVWVNSGSWWWTGRPGMLQFMESQRVGHDWATDLIWFATCVPCVSYKSFLIFKDTIRNIVRIKWLKTCLTLWVFVTPWM